MSVGLVKDSSMKCFQFYRRCFRFYSVQPNFSKYESYKDPVESLRNASAREVYSHASLFPWYNLSGFCNHLMSSIVYNKDGLIVLNKPFGVRVYKHHEEDPKLPTKVLTIKEYKFTIEDCLPTLKKHLNEPQLHIVKSLEKNTSGIVLLATSEKTAEKLTKSFSISRQKTMPHLTYWMLMSEVPDMPYRKEKVGLKNVPVGGKGEMQPVIVTEMSLRSIKSKIVHPAHVEYRTLSSNEDLNMSLVEVASTINKKHFFRVYSSFRIGSILGDELFSSRRGSLLGVSILRPPRGFDKLKPEIIPEKLWEVLALRKNSAEALTMPTMLHFRSLLLCSFNGSDVVIEAEPPVHFQWTRNKLKLEL